MMRILRGLGGESWVSDTHFVTIQEPKTLLMEEKARTQVIECEL